MNPLTINILSVTKGGNHTSTNRNRLLYLNKGFIIQRNLEKMKKKKGEVNRSFIVRWKDELDSTWHLLIFRGSTHSITYNQDLVSLALLAG